MKLNNLGKSILKAIKENISMGDTLLSFALQEEPLHLDSNKEEHWRDVTIKVRIGHIPGDDGVVIENLY